MDAKEGPKMEALVMFTDDPQTADDDVDIVGVKPDTKLKTGAEDISSLQLVTDAAADKAEVCRQVAAGVKEKPLPVFTKPVDTDVAASDVTAGAKEKLLPVFISPVDRDVAASDVTAGVKEKPLPVFTTAADTDVDIATHKQFIIDEVNNEMSYVYTRANAHAF